MIRERPPDLFLLQHLLKAGPYVAAVRERQIKEYLTPLFPLLFDDVHEAFSAGRSSPGSELQNGRLYRLQFFIRPLVPDYYVSEELDQESG